MDTIEMHDINRPEGDEELKGVMMKPSLAIHLLMKATF
jgi:hypothetical protein